MRVCAIVNCGSGDYLLNRWKKTVHELHEYKKGVVHALFESHTVLLLHYNIIRAQPLCYPDYAYLICFCCFTYRLGGY